RRALPVRGVRAPPRRHAPTRDLPRPARFRLPLDLRETNMKLTCFALATIVAMAACGSDEIDSNEQARRAYLGLDGSIAKSVKLGFDGFNMASSANIMPQTTAGLSAGTITVTGQVDQGSSSNKGMRLYVGMVGYTDGNLPIDMDNHTIHVVYDTSTDA